MRNNFSVIRWLSRVSLFAMLMGVLFTACKKQEITIPAAQGEFTTASATYYIQDTPTSVYHIPVGATALSTTARSITYKIVSSTATEGQQFSFGGTKGTVTIPADSAIGFLDIKGIFAGYTATPGRIDTIVLQVTGGDIPAASFNTTFTLYLQQYCDVILSDLVGTYNNSFDTQGGSSGGLYSIVVTGTSTGPTSATLVFQNLAAAFFGPFAPTDAAVNPGVSVKIDWSDPSNFQANVVSGPLYLDPTYGPATIVGLNGSFSSCTGIFVLNYAVDVFNGGATFGDFTTYVQP